MYFTILEGRKAAIVYESKRQMQVRDVQTWIHNLNGGDAGILHYNTPCTMQALRDAGYKVFKFKTTRGADLNAANWNTSRPGKAPDFWIQNPAREYERQGFHY